MFDRVRCSAYLSEVFVSAYLSIIVIIQIESKISYVERIILSNLRKTTKTSSLFLLFESSHCVKRVRIRSYSGLYFPAFRLNTERCRVSLHIQSKCGTFYAIHSLGHFSLIFYFYTTWNRQKTFDFLTFLWK